MIITSFPSEVNLILSPVATLWVMLQLMKMLVIGLLLSDASKIDSNGYAFSHQTGLLLCGSGSLYSWD